MTAPWRSLLGESLLPDLFLPTYWVYGGWPKELMIFAYVLSVVAAFGWLLPRVAAPVRRISLTVFLGMFYVCSIILFPWYSPPWAALAYLALALVGNTAAQALARRTALLPVLRISLALVLVIQAGIWIGSMWEMRQRQQIIENTVRRPIGLWLREHARAGDTVFLEPLGYIGFYSGLKMYDYPGLSSPEVVTTIRNGSRRFAEVIRDLEPTWLVLRPFEFADARLPENAALRNYELIQVWNAKSRIEEIPLLPGRPWFLYDGEFRVYRRRAAETPTAGE